MLRILSHRTKMGIPSQSTVRRESAERISDFARCSSPSPLSPPAPPWTWARFSPSSGRAFRDIRVTARGIRGDGTPAPFTAINLHFDLYGTIEEAQAHKALDLAVYKYCSVGAMLTCSVEITWTMTLHPETAGPESPGVRR
jgi:hypothetical protein